MPIYEYQCQSCHKELEVLQKISDEPLLQCPQCGEASLKKKISAAAFRLKGSGWYETDFKTGNKKNIAGGSDSPSSEGSAANSEQSKPSTSSSSSSESSKSDGKKTA